MKWNEGMKWSGGMKWDEVMKYNRMKWMKCDEVVGNEM